MANRRSSRIPQALSFLTDAVTKRNGEAQALRESDQRYRALFDRSLDAVYLHDFEGNLLDANDAALRMLGYSRDEISTLSFADLLDESQLPTAVATLQEIMTTSFQAEMTVFQLRRKDGSIVEVETLASVITENGQPIAIQGIARDITERRRAEAALRTANEELERRVALRTAELEQRNTELRLLELLTRMVGEAEDFESALQVMLREVCETTGWDYGEAWVPRADGEVLVCRPVSYTKLGILHRFGQASEGIDCRPGFGLPGRVWLSKEPEWIEDVSSVSETLFARSPIATEAGLKATVAFPVMVSDEVVAVLLLLRLRSQAKDQGHIDVLQAIGTQLGAILRRKRLEQAQRESDERYRALFARAPALLHSVDAEGCIVAVNERWLEVMGYSESEVLGRPSVEFLADDDRERGRTITIPKVRNEGSVTDVPHRFKKKNGEIIDVLVSAVAQYDAAGNVMGILAILNDITERKRLEEQLQRAREELEGKVERQMVRKNPYGLTFRELTILHPLAAGRSDKEIATELVISPLTVKKHVSNILGKMNAASRTEAATRALREGLLD